MSNNLYNICNEPTNSNNQNNLSPSFIITYKPININPDFRAIMQMLCQIVLQKKIYLGQQLTYQISKILFCFIKKTWEYFNKHQQHLYSFMRQIQKLIKYQNQQKQIILKSFEIILFNSINQIICIFKKKINNNQFTTILQYLLLFQRISDLKQFQRYYRHKKSLDDLKSQLQVSKGCPHYFHYSNFIFNFYFLENKIIQ
ncbi:hypothetical protein pb186bvf_005044 [Paramecium bursaria]